MIFKIITIFENCSKLYYIHFGSGEISNKDDISIHIYIYFLFPIAISKKAKYCV